MTVQELCELFVNDGCQVVHIWSDECNAVIWIGWADDVPEMLQTAEVSSIDNIYDGNNGIITINIFGDELELPTYTVHDEQGNEWLVCMPKNLVEEIMNSNRNWGNFDESDIYYADDGSEYNVCINQNRVTLWEE